MGLLNTTQYRVTAKDTRSAGNLNSGAAFRIDSADAAFNSVAANGLARAASISEIDVSRVNTKTEPADGESRPRRYDAGVTDMADRTYSCYWDDGTADTNPAKFFTTMREAGAAVEIVDYPNSGSTSLKLTATYLVSSVKQMKSGGEQQMLEVTLQFDGKTFIDARV